MSEDKLSLRILLVEDSEHDMLAFKRTFRGSGIPHEITLRVRAEEALALLHQDASRFDLVVADYKLPGMTGLELCEQLICENTDLPLVILTGSGTEDVAVKALKMGVNDYIIKDPYNGYLDLLPIVLPQVVQRHSDRLARQKAEDDLKKHAEKLEILNEKLRKSEKTLKELNDAKNRFFSIIAHDLQGSISSFFLGVNLLSDVDDLDEDLMRSIIGQLKQSVVNLRKLLENLLQWARSQMNNIEFNPSQIKLKFIVDQVIELLQAGFANKKLMVINECQPEVYVYVDPNVIETILRNLLANAIKFTPSGGSITIFSEEKGDFVEIAVADTGIGIEKELIPKLFDIGERHRKRGTEGERGTGLGLILSKEFVEKNGGQIWVESQVGKGSIFRFTLPKIDNA